MCFPIPKSKNQKIQKSKNPKFSGQSPRKLWIFGLGFWIGFLYFGLSLLIRGLYSCRYSIPVQALWHPFTFAVWPLVAGSAYNIWRSVSFCFAARLDDGWCAFSTLLLKQSAQHSPRDCPHVLVFVPVRELRYPDLAIHDRIPRLSRHELESFPEMSPKAVDDLGARFHFQRWTGWNLDRVNLRVRRVDPCGLRQSMLTHLHILRELGCKYITN